MQNFTVARWHPDDTSAPMSTDLDDLDVALTTASTMKDRSSGVPDDTRVTIFFNHTGRWVEWIYEKEVDVWRFYEM